MYRSIRNRRAAWQTALVVLAVAFALPPSLRGAVAPALASAFTKALRVEAETPYRAWKHHVSLFLLTTPEGANLPASATEHDFPVLVRLHRDTFDFSQANRHGEDMRFSSAQGTPLSYQIEEWDTPRGVASIWVKVPTIKGNARQELVLHWGNADAKSESRGSAVFNTSNGYLSVLHMRDPVADEVGTLTPTNVGTTMCEGVIGKARRFGGGQGIRCGDKIANLPSGAGPSTSEAWFRADSPNSTLFGWGNEGGGRGSKVRMLYQSPPHVRVDSDFADVKGSSTLPLHEWIHVAHTYERGHSRIYVNGRLDGATTPEFTVKSPARMWIGGWYDQYSFVGDIDEVRISKVARSADWIKLQYENQKPLQTLTGHLVQPGNGFSVSRTTVEVPEGKSATITAKAGGAQKVRWILERGGIKTVVAVDRLTYRFDAGRVVGDQSLVLRFEAVYPTETKSEEIRLTIKEAIPEPVFTLSVPAKWNGRDALEVVPQIANRKEMEAKGAGELKFTWHVSDIAVIKQVMPDKLILRRAQKSGILTVSVSVSNGGAATVRTATTIVEQPSKDAWVARTPAREEKPTDNQFYPREDGNKGTIHYNGTLKDAAESVFLKVYAGDALAQQHTQKLVEGNRYAFAVKIEAGLIVYKVEFGSRNGGRDKILHSVTNLVCGDAYLINGQSNADATDVGKDDPPFTSQWIRTFGSMAGHPAGARTRSWGNAVCRNRKGGDLQVGYWGLELARRLVESQKMPICILNGAVGGSRIDQHQRNSADPEDVTTIYGRLLWRVRQANLTHGIRGVIWHQGENDQGADGPTGRYGWETYREFFFDLSAGWKQDYPNIEHYYLFQIWPKACSMGVNGSDNALREVQRTLPNSFSNLSIMSTLGINPPGGCHFPLAGYAEFARLLCPLVERDIYRKVFANPVTPPDLKRVYYTSDKRDELALEFDQSVSWSPSLASQFYLDGAAGGVVSGSVSCNVLTLKTKNATAATRITYLDSKAWSEKNLLRGGNGIAALTFWNVPIAVTKPSR